MDNDQNNLDSPQFKIHSLYKDFFSFLKRRGKYRWGEFQQFCLNKDKPFYREYFQSFTYSQKMLQERIGRIREEHYMNLATLIRNDPPELIATNSIKRCINVLSLKFCVDIYLIVGFFSADGFVLKIKEKPIIGIGLERFQTFKSLDIIIAHEYAHLVRISNGFESKDFISRIINEGIATVFSESIMKNRTLPEHLFLSNAEYNKLLLKKRDLLNMLSEATKIHSPYRMISSARERNFTGYIIIKSYIQKHDLSISEVIKKTDPETLTNHFNTNLSL